MIRYVFAEDSPLTIRGSADADPQVIGTALEEIRASNGGELQPTAVVEAAKSRKNPLHQHFLWDVQAAAEAHWIDQARTLIRCVRIVDKDAERGHVRAFVSIASPTGTSYRSVGEIKSSAALRAAVLLQAERELEAFERRYRELKDICEVVSTAREMAKKKREESRASA